MTLPISAAATILVSPVRVRRLLYVAEMGCCLSVQKLYKHSKMREGVENRGDLHHGPPAHTYPRSQHPHTSSPGTNPPPPSSTPRRGSSTRARASVGRRQACTASSQAWGLWRPTVFASAWPHLIVLQGSIVYIRTQNHPPSASCSGRNSTGTPLSCSFFNCTAIVSMSLTSSV